MMLFIKTDHENKCFTLLDNIKQIRSYGVLSKDEVRENIKVFPNCYEEAVLRNNDIEHCSIVEYRKDGSDLSIAVDVPVFVLNDNGDKIFDIQPFPLKDRLRHNYETDKQ